MCLGHVGVLRIGYFAPTVKTPVLIRAIKRRKCGLKLLMACSTPRGLFEVYKQGQSLNRKRPPESQPAASPSFVEAHGTDVSGYIAIKVRDIISSHEYIDAIAHGQKRQKAGSCAYDEISLMPGFESTHANSHQTFRPTGMRNGIQVYMDDTSVYPEGFPQEIHHNLNHGRPFSEQGETYSFPPNPSFGLVSRDDALVNSVVNNPDADRLSGVDKELGDIDFDWYTAMDQLDLSTFPDLDLAGHDHIKVPDDATTQHHPQSQSLSKSRGLGDEFQPNARIQTVKDSTFPSR
ncbi:hypothetical protein H4Q26_011870 [Puccinia striiformis f. sp. tritici PST-130]|nr:hypothetical protein H4Q26_011870 [Puccinia striiformis f. sp. tritici PST-130]